ncbi:MAG: heavy-metal-associated domain-containing protein, partial [Gammaproteobacteria bacterium]|nr:heavy-metal-associated domain-containing protein [Gammaproteobacteria bacterium]NIR85781.1 heavy-metal-associated domain-containing protein [Gammaproteobacteria bacterium]NIU06916.1 heavy-metal-associated domain-containing protein [Gammaproteobacteria bacterium]NIV53846.1 copper chaperone [Gammaproteobacteria bacterium]NIX88189.1 copper chaperone [Gammaproteobacteria bacterium]
MNTIRSLLVAVTFAGWSSGAWAGGALYVMRVDGLACPYCAYGVEQKLEKIDGVRDESIEFDLEKGVVRVEVEEGVH